MISIFAIILVTFIIYTLINTQNKLEKYKKLLIINISFELLMIQGYFFKLGTSELSYQAAMSLIMIPYTAYFIMSENVKIGIKELFMILFFLVSCMIGIMHQYIEPYSGSIMNSSAVGSWDAYIIGINNKGSVEISWTRFLVIYAQFISVMMTILIFHNAFSFDDIRHILKKVNIILRWNVYFVILEFFVKNIMISDTTMQLEGILLGDGSSTYTTLILRNGFYQLQGLTREPSHLAFTLFYTVIFFIVEKRIINSKYKICDYLYLIMVITLSFISGSFAAILYILTLLIWIVYLAIKNASDITKIAILVISVAVVSSVGYSIYSGISDDSLWGFGKRIDLTTQIVSAIADNNWQSSGGDSALPRFISIYDTFFDFLDRPLFGMGIGIQYSHGGLVNVLSDIGVIGVIMWWKMALGSYGHDILSILILFLGSNLFIGSIIDYFGMSSMVFFLACLRNEWNLNGQSNMKYEEK